MNGVSTPVRFRMGNGFWIVDDWQDVYPVYVAVPGDWAHKLLDVLIRRVSELREAGILAEGEWRMVYSERYWKTGYGGVPSQHVMVGIDHYAPVDKSRYVREGAQDEG